MLQANTPATREEILAEECSVVVFWMCSKDAAAGGLALANSQTPTQLLTLLSPHPPEGRGRK